MLKLFNTMTGQLQEFRPISEFEVKMYVCGPTVYSDAHLGHARAYIAYDSIYRYLSFLGYNVTYVRNITDIDDKIIKRANDEGVGFKVIAEKYTQSFHDDMQALGLQTPDVEPKASEVIVEIIEMIQALIEKGVAYAIAKGDVYFAVAKHNSYGALSKRKLEDLKAGARVDPDESKQDPLDFALWKSAKPNEPYWESPWGQGRPGWHIECSAMNQKILGKSIDIHAGGRDLIFPHHENEIAQSEACNDETFAKYWLHNGFVTLKQEKMSKSLGNVWNIKTILSKVHPEAMKLYFFSSHYRHPIDFSLENLAETAKSLNKMYRSISFRDGNDIDQDAVDAFKAAMSEDFNTAKAMVSLFDQLKKVHTAQKPQDKARAANTIYMLANILGLLQWDEHSYQQWYVDHYQVNVQQVEKLIEERDAARANKDFATADMIRDTLLEQNIQVEDTPQGSSWSVKLS